MIENIGMIVQFVAIGCVLYALYKAHQLNKSASEIEKRIDKLRSEQKDDTIYRL